MTKLDEVKEILNTLRIAMSIAFGILVIVVGSVIKYRGQTPFREVFLNYPDTYNGHSLHF